MFYFYFHFVISLTIVVAVDITQNVIGLQHVFRTIDLLVISSIDFYKEMKNIL